MATKIGVKSSMGELDRGVTDGISFPVDDTLTSGITWGKILALKTNGLSAKWNDYLDNAGIGVTLIYADNTSDSLFPVSVAYDTSRKDMYGDLATQLADSVVFYPIGTKQENKGLVRTKDVYLDVYDDTDQDLGIYNAVKQTLTGTVEVAGGTLDTVDGTNTTFDTELVAGDYIEVEGQVEQVLTVDSAVKLTLRTDLASAVAAGKTAYKDSMLDKPLYLSTSGDFTHIYPATGNVWIVGEIVTSKMVRIYLYNLVGQYK